MRTRGFLASQAPSCKPWHGAGESRLVLGHQTNSANMYKFETLLKLWPD